ncbi:MAG: hypothetical protein AAGF47_07485 [Planctomycetota bacterium]
MAGLVLFCGFVLVIIIGISNATPMSASASSVSSAPADVEDSPAYPFKLVNVLSQQREFMGMTCFLRPEGKGWQKSSFDGIWTAVLRRQFGDNEVSCYIDSESRDTVRNVELEAEFWRPGYRENEIMRQFASSAQILMHPKQPSRDFAEAIANKSNWSGNGWRLERTNYANGGFGYMLKREH